MNMITVLGSTGFVGSHLVQKLSERDIPYQAPHHEENLDGRDLDTIIYCIGLTADFRARPLDTVEAHVCKLLEVIRLCHYKKIVYLSSTRLYKLSMPSAEDSTFLVSPDSPSDLYNISKLMGEALIHTLDNSGQVVRLSNVYGWDAGSDNFLSHIIRDALRVGSVTLETTMDSEKDYINVNNVVDLLIEIATQGSQKVYNIASGMNISNREILEKLSQLTGCDVHVRDDAKTVKYSQIPISFVQSEFDFSPSNLLKDLPGLVDLYKRNNKE